MAVIGLSEFYLRVIFMNPTKRRVYKCERTVSVIWVYFLGKVEIHLME